MLRRLLRCGYRAFLVGGAVRDLLLGREPKDYDVGTDASPEEVRDLFRNSRAIGRRFRIIHVYFKGNKIIEVSTFRDSVAADTVDEQPTLAADNTFGDPETDAVRRDLTINGLFYDLSTFSVIDYVGGIKDLREGVIRIIGEPEVRIQEDPVRMIRAVRHAARLGFLLESRTLDAICRQKNLIKLCPLSRLHEEFLRDMCGGAFAEAIRLLHETGLLAFLLPLLDRELTARRSEVWPQLEQVLLRIDERIKRGEEPSTAVVLAALFIGNLPLTVEAGSGFGEAAKYWARSPVAEAAPDGGEEQEQTPGQSLLFRLSARQNRQRSAVRSRRAKQSPLSKMIARIFEAVGVPRRDRERMEQLLLARYCLYTVSSEETEHEQRRRIFTPELRMLAQLLGEEEKLNAAVSGPEGQTDRLAGQSRHKKGRRRGRRRRR